MTVQYKHAFFFWHCRQLGCPPLDVTLKPLYCIIPSVCFTPAVTQPKMFKILCTILLGLIFFPFSSCTGCCRRHHWRLQLQLISVLEGPFAWTWPLTARRFRGPFTNKTQVKGHKLLRCHGKLKKLAAANLFLCYDISGQILWCLSADRSGLATPEVAAKAR